MTQNQIAYAQAQEQKRHNAQSEQNERAALYENFRHNVAMEKEGKRHNMSVEATTHQSNYETMRHNTQQERITSAYNTGNLFVAQQQADIASRNADTNAINAQTNRYGYELNKLMLPYNQAESKSRTGLNTISTEMRPYETGVKLVDTIVHAFSAFKPKKGRS